MLNELFVIFVLTLINGVFSMSETAIISSRRTRLEMKAKKGNAGAKQAIALLNAPNRFLSTVQIGITLVGILLGIFSGETIKTNIATFFLKMPLIAPYANQLALACNVVFIGFLSLVFGELIPKRIGMAKPEAIAQTVALPMNFISRVTAPFIWVLSKTTELFIRILGIKSDSTGVTEEEIKAMVDEGATSGAIEEVEQAIVERVFHMGDKKIGALMTNRSEIVWLDLNDELQKNLELVDESRHAVYPVADDSLDNFVGVVSSKNILSHFLHQKTINLREMATQVNIFPENMSAYIALEKFKETRIHQGIVVNEYGTVVGIVTMKDILDSLIGDLSESDDAAIAYEILQREDGSWLVDGQYPWDDLLKELDIDADDSLLDEGFHTISGFILHELEAIPKVGEKITWSGFTFEVIDLDGTRIDKILISKN